MPYISMASVVSKETKNGIDIYVVKKLIHKCRNKKKVKYFYFLYIKTIFLIFIFMESRVLSSKIPNVDNPMREVHCVFSRECDVDECDEHNNKRVYVFYDLIFAYIFNRPAIICDKHVPFGRYLYFFNTHELYENAIQHMIDNRNGFCIEYWKGDGSVKEQEYINMFKYMFDFRDPYIVFGGPDVKTEDIYLIQDCSREDRLDRTIRTLSFFTKDILAFAPFLEFQTCDECGEETPFQEQYINVNENNETGVTSCCEECFQEYHSDDTYFKKPANNFNEIRATIDRILFDYHSDKECL